MLSATVLTGDLIGSTKVPPASLEAAFDRLADTARAISRLPGSTADTRLTRFRGDGWQEIVTPPHLALRAALLIYAALRAADLRLTTRIGIGMGAVDSLGTHTLADAHGTAFELAGRALDGMSKIQIFAIQGPHITKRDQIIVALIEEFARRWTVQQAEAMAAWLRPDAPTLAEIGAEFGITPQAVNYRLKGAGGNVIRRVLNDWEHELEIEQTDRAIALARTKAQTHND